MKKKTTREPCLCDNRAAVDILSSAVESECEEVARYAHQEDWETAIDVAHDLCGILESIRQFHARTKGGKR